MSVLIKGMELPEYCGDCPMADSLSCQLMPGVPALWVEFTSAVREKRRHTNCPLIELPPHGRLIDADEFYKSLKKWNAKFYSAYEKDKKDERIAALLELDLAVRVALKDAPTIIPASEGKEE